MKISREIYKLIIEIIVLVGGVIFLISCGYADQDNYLEALDYIWIPENDVLTPFLVISKTEESYLVIRKHTTGPSEFSFIDSYNSYYENSALDQYLNTEYAERFAPEVLTFILDSNVEITAEESIGCCGQKTIVIKRHFFEPSWTETTGRYNSTSPKEGEQFSKQFTHSFLATTNDRNIPSVWWLRTPITWECNRILGINEDGGVSSGTTVDTNGTYLADVRPAFRISLDAPIEFEDGRWCLCINTE